VDDLPQKLDEAIEKATEKAKGHNYADGYSLTARKVSSSSASSSVVTSQGSWGGDVTTEVYEFSQSYNQDYSVVEGNGTLTVRRDSSRGTTESIDFKINKVAGFATPEKGLPKAGAATYEGKAFSAANREDELSNLKYTVDFDEQKGSALFRGLLMLI
ncbi:MAG: factor H binding family protein, partial [Neisseria sp.]|nr:factor H binding family protein [Neisseria sp.]